MSNPKTVHPTPGPGNRDYYSTLCEQADADFANRDPGRSNPPLAHVVGKIEAATRRHNAGSRASD